MYDVLAMFRHTLETEGKMLGTPDSCTINRAMEICCDVWQLGAKEHDWEKVRNQAAIAAMQSFIGKFNINIRDRNDCEKIAKLSIEQADELIKQLKKK